MSVSRRHAAICQHVVFWHKTSGGLGAVGSKHLGWIKVIAGCQTHSDCLFTHRMSPRASLAICCLYLEGLVNVFSAVLLTVFQ